MTYKGASVVGMMIQVGPGNDSSGLERIKAIYPEIEPDKQYMICFVCLLRVMGVKP